MSGFLGFNLGGSSSKSKSHSYIDDKTSGAQWDNYNSARGGLLSQYTPVTSDQIAAYQNPFNQQVVDRSMADLERQRQMAVNTMGDQAMAAHAYGGSRHGVADALTNEGFARQGGLLSAGLYAQGFDAALNAATGENHFGYQYPLARQGLLNQTLAGITPQTFNKGKQSSFQWGVQGGVKNPELSPGDLAQFFGA